MASSCAISRVWHKQLLNLSVLGIPRMHLQTHHQPMSCSCTSVPEKYSAYPGLDSSQHVGGKQKNASIPQTAGQGRNWGTPCLCQPDRDRKGEGSHVTNEKKADVVQFLLPWEPAKSRRVWSFWQSILYFLFSAVDICGFCLTPVITPYSSNVIPDFTLGSFIFLDGCSLGGNTKQ